MSRVPRKVGASLAVLGFALAALSGQLVSPLLTGVAYAGHSAGGAVAAPARAVPGSLPVPDRRDATRVSAPESLTVSMTSINPSSLTPGQPVRVGGAVTNTDTSTWTNLQVFLVLSPEPMTTATQLAEALANAPDAFLGPRIISSNPRPTWVQMGDLAPGATKTYRLDVAYNKLGVSGAAGVYWLAVHVIGTDPQGTRDATADARARTFIPLVAPSTATSPVRVSVLWPLTAPVRARRPGVYLDDSLGRAMATDGRLNRLLRMAIGWQDRLSWVIDPAVVQAARTMSGGYVVNGAEPSPGAFSEVAKSFLSDFRDQIGSSTQLSVPFADPDVNAIARSRRGGLLAAASSAGVSTLRSMGLQTVAVSWPVGGLSKKGALAAASRNGARYALLSQSSIADWQPGSSPLVTMRSGQSDPADITAAVYVHAVFEADPEPGDVDRTLQARQRLLAQAALLSLDPGATRFLVVAAPRAWNPGPGWFAAAFFSGLNTSWLRLTPLTGLLGRTPVSYAGLLRYPDALSDRELPQTTVTAAKELRHASTVVSSLRAGSAAAGSGFDRSVALGISWHWRSDPVTATDILGQQLRHIRRQLDGVSVQSAQAVTLSSNNGRFPVTVSNELDRPVTVRLKVQPANPALQIKVPGALAVGANERVQVQVDASSDRVGLTTVSVRLATADGRGFGRVQQINVRTTQYGVVGWVIVAAGCAVLFGTSLRRVLRRLRRRRSGAAS